jgi:hypothetical protein
MCCPGQSWLETQQNYYEKFHMKKDRENPSRYCNILSVRK